MKKKAFTLTELLVVVVIIGVLSAVVLPKFTHVIEEHKITEAENIMRAIRTEQEARCALDKSYTGATSELSSWPAHSGANYQYELLASGLHATKTDNAYQLFMGYRNGRICCQGSGCNALGKYASCDNAYLAQINDPSGECAAQNVGTAGIETPVIPEGCELTDEQIPCPAGKEGTAWNRVTANCTYEADYSGCHGINTPECTLQEEQIPCPEGYEGTAWNRVTANCTYEADYSGCTQKKDCEDGEKKDVESSCGTSKGKKCVNGKWENFEESVSLTPEEKADCRCNSKPADETQPCAEGEGTQTRTYTCDTATGNWTAGEWTGECGSGTQYVWEEVVAPRQITGGSCEYVQLPGAASYTGWGHLTNGGVVCYEEIIHPIWDAWEVTNNPKQPNCPAGIAAGMTVPAGYSGPTECISERATYVRCAIIGQNGETGFGPLHGAEPYYPGACYRWKELHIVPAGGNTNGNTNGNGGRPGRPGGRS